MHYLQIRSLSVSKKEKESKKSDLKDPSLEKSSKTWLKQYGTVGVVTHGTLSIVSLTLIYTGIKSGVDIVSLIEKIGLFENIPVPKTTGDFILAYGMYKILSPIRWPLTIALTPIVFKWNNHRKKI